MHVTTIILSTKFANKEEIVSGTRSEDPETLRLSSQRVFLGKIYSFFCLGYLFFLLDKKNCKYSHKSSDVYLVHILLEF